MQRRTMAITFQTKYLWKAKKKYANYSSKSISNYADYFSNKYLWKATTNYANYFSKAISLKCKDELWQLLFKQNIFGKQKRNMQITLQNQYL